jgi:DNA-binding CsgD family transcriptional regulator
MFVDSLSLECKQIADLLIQGYSQTEISEIISKNKSTTIKQIGAKINIIRKNLVKYYHEC